MDPTKLNRPLLRELVDKYGYADIAAELDRRDGWPLEEDFLTGGMPPDDYIHCNITQKQDWIDLYATPYYFGCEADDRMNAVAFGKAMPLGARINAIYSSDIGHFDVVDMRDPLPEAFELVEDGHITEERFPRLRLRQCGAAVGHAEPALLRGHGGGQGSGGVVEARRPDPHPAMTSPHSRRDVLKGTAALAVAATVGTATPTRRAHAQAGRGRDASTAS